MNQAAVPIPELFRQLEALYGRQSPCWPTDPYRFLVWWHCGYPPGDAACAKGWEALNAEVGVEPAQLLAAGTARLERALKPGGMVPALRAMRLMEIADRIQNEYGGDLRPGLAGPLGAVRKALKRFPGIADPGVDRILLFGGLAPIPAIPSNCPHVLVRIQRGPEGKDYSVTYRQAQQAIESGIPADFGERTRAYLLLKRHGQTLCKRTSPNCRQCPLNGSCAYFAYHRGGPPASA